METIKKIASKIANHIIDFDREDLYIIEEILSEIKEEDYKSLYADFVKSMEFKSIALVNQLAKKYRDKLVNEAKDEVEKQAKELANKCTIICEWVERISIEKNVPVSDILKDITFVGFKTTDGEDFLTSNEISLLSEIFENRENVYNSYWWNKTFEIIKSHLVTKKSSQKTITNIPAVLNGLKILRIA